jgi:hypothetical protein
MALSPTKWNRSTLLIVLAFLLVMPALADYLYSRAQTRKDARDDELVQRYECEPPDKCVADFNGDGVAESLILGDGEFVVKVTGREVLRMPYDHTDGTFRTHFAITNTGGKSRLLLYDGVTHRPPLSAAFGWDGGSLVNTSPSDIEREILSAMTAHDDSGGWNERAFRPLFRSARLFVFYFALAIILALVLFKRFVAHGARST